MRARSGKSPRYCYIIERGPISCLLGHLTGLLFCCYVKLVLPSSFFFVDFWSSRSCLVLVIQLADLNVFRGLWAFIDGKVQGYLFRPPEKEKPTKQAFWWTTNLRGTVWKSGCLKYSVLPNILLRDVRCEYFARGTEKCNILGSFLDKDMENL